MHEMTKNLKLIERSVAKVVCVYGCLEGQCGQGTGSGRTGDSRCVHSKLLIKLTLGVDLRDALRLEEVYVDCK